MKKLMLIALFTMSSLSVFAQQEPWTLEQCVNYALENNISIQRNQLDVKSAAVQTKAAKGNFLPNLNAGVNQSFSFGLNAGSTGVATQNNRSNTGFNIGSSTTLFNGFRNSSEYKKAKLGNELSQLALEKMENDISLNVVNAYLNILFNRENLEVAKIQADISKEQVKRISELFEAGSAPKGDLYEIEATLANDVQNLITVENSLNISRLNLAQILQIPYENFDVADIDIEAPSIALLEEEGSSEVYERALQIMPEIKQAELSYESTNYDVKIAKSGFMPSLNFNLGANTGYFYNYADIPINPINNLPSFSDDQWNPSFGDQFKDNRNYSISFGMNIPIFNRNQNKAAVKRAKLNQERSELALAEQKQNLYQSIESAFLDAQAAIKTFDAAKLSLKSQLEAFRNAEERFDLGVLTSYDFNLSRNGLVNAQATLIRSKFDYIFKMKLLRFYYGEPIVGPNEL
jgi:outer membrane protein